MSSVCVSKTIIWHLFVGVATQPVKGVQVQLLSVPYDKKTLMVKAIIESPLKKKKKKYFCCLLFLSQDTQRNRIECCLVFYVMTRKWMDGWITGIPTVSSKINPKLESLFLPCSANTQYGWRRNKNNSKKQQPKSRWKSSKTLKLLSICCIFCPFLNKPTLFTSCVAIPLIACNMQMAPDGRL